MNLLLLASADLVSEDQKNNLHRIAPSAFSRLEPKLRVLGARFHVGIENGPTGIACVIEPNGLVQVAWKPERPTYTPRLTMLVGLPRPKVFKRLCSSLAQLEVSEVRFVITELTERSYLTSHALQMDTIMAAMRDGAEQARLTALPHVRVHRSLAESVPCLPQTERRFVMTQNGPHAERDTSLVSPTSELVIAVGGEHGFSDSEKATLGAHHFKPCSLGDFMLRVDVAVVAAIGRLR